MLSLTNSRLLRDIRTSNVAPGKYKLLSRWNPDLQKQTLSRTFTPHMDLTNGLLVVMVHSPLSTCQNSGSSENKKISSQIIQQQSKLIENNLQGFFFNPISVNIHLLYEYQIRLQLIDTYSVGILHNMQYSFFLKFRIF